MRNKLLISLAILEIALQIGCGSSNKKSSDNTDDPIENTQQLCDDTDCQKVPVPNPTEPAAASPYEVTLQKLAASYCTAQPLADFEADDYQFLKTQKYLVTYFAGRPSLLVSVDGEWDEVSVDATKIEAKCDKSASKNVLVHEAKVYASDDFNLSPVCVLPLGYEFGNNLSYTYSSESYATLSFDGMKQHCNGAETGYSPEQVVFFNLVKKATQPPVVQPPVVQPPVAQPDCGNNYLTYYNTAYKYAYDSTGMNYAAETARKFASLAAEKTCAYPQWLDSFKDAREYAYSYTGMNLNASAAYDFAMIAANKEIASKGWLALFKDAREYAYSYTGMNLNASAAYDFAIIATNKETASKGWLALFKDARDYAYSYTGMNLNASAAYDFAIIAADKEKESKGWLALFKDARDYAYSYTGMNLNASAAYDFAIIAADKEKASKGWLATFKDARDYAYSYTGMNLNASAAYDFALLAANKLVSKPNWFQKFKEAYTYAYSSSGLNLNASAAYDFALNAADR